MVWTLFGLLWVMPRSIIDLLSSWQGSFGGHQSIDLWRAVHIVPYGVFGDTELKMFRGEGMVYFGT